MGQMYYRANDGTVVPISASTASPIQEGLDPATGANGMFFYDTDATTAQYTQRGKQIEFRIVGTLSAAPSGAVSVTIPQTAASTNYFGSARLLVDSSNYQGAWYPTSTTVITVRYLDDANIWQALSGSLPAAWASGHTITIAGSY